MVLEAEKFQEHDGASIFLASAEGFILLQLVLQGRRIRGCMRKKGKRGVVTSLVLPVRTLIHLEKAVIHS
jgi:hypothetical protein